MFGGVGAFILMFLLTFRFPWESVSRRYHEAGYEASFWLAWPDYLLTFLLVGVVLFMFLQYAKRKDVMGALFGALPLLALVGYAFSETSVAFSTLLFDVFLLLVSVIRTMIGIRTNQLGVVNTGMLMLAALILARFFDSEIHFIVKGLVFILIGVGFLVTNLVLLRRKEETS